MTGSTHLAGSAAGDRPPGRSRPAPAWLPVLCLLGSCWVVAAGVEFACAALSSRICLAGIAVSAVLIALTAMLLLTRSASLVLISVAGAALGLTVAFAGAWSLHTGMDAVEESATGAYVLDVVEDARTGQYGRYCIAKTTLATGQRVRVRINLPDDVDVRCWDTVHATCRLSLPSDGSASYYWSKGMAATATLSNLRIEGPGGILGTIAAMREAGIAAIEEACAELPSCSDGAILLKALVFGDRAELFSCDLYESVKAVGLAHIVAVSGTHLVIVSGLFASLLRLTGLSRRACLPIQCAFVIAYACLTGLPVSVMRAGGMTICALSSFYAKRRSSSANALGICILLMLASDPSLALSVSLALSACASLGIMLLASYASLWIQTALGGRARRLSDCLGVSLAASASTMPISVPMFAQIPLVSPLSNLLAAAACPLLVCGGIVCTLAACADPVPAALVLAPLLRLAQAFCEAVILLGRLPYACIAADARMVPLAVAVVSGAVALLYFRPVPDARTGRALAVCSCLLLAAVLIVFPNLKGTQIIALDVGQGDAILLRHGAHAVLVDTGNDDAKLLAALARHDVRTLDALIVSHPDDDHCGSLPALASVVEIERICVAADLLECGCDSCSALRESAGDIEIVGLDKGDVLSFACFSLEVVSPEGFTDEGGNDDSLVMVARVDCDGDGQGEWTMLTGGDAEAEVLEGLCETGEIGDVDILKVPHHGSKAGLNETVLETLDPEAALISVGESNSYGHPADETLALLEAQGTAIYRTDLQGDLVCNLNARRISIRAST